MGLASSRAERAVSGQGPDRSRPLSDRPWSTAYAPSGPEWSRRLLEAIDGKTLSLEDLAQDVREGLARPSILYQAKRRIADPFRLPPEALRLDDGFLPPEIAVSCEQLRILRQDDLRFRFRWFFKSIRDRLASLVSVPLKRLGLKDLSEQWSDGLAALRARFRPRQISQAGPEYEWVFVLKRKSRDRVIEEACAKIGQHFAGKYCVYFAANAATLPRAKNYCFPEVSFFEKCFQRYPVLRESSIAVFDYDAKRAGKANPKKFDRATARIAHFEVDPNLVAGDPRESERVARALCEAGQAA